MIVQDPTVGSTVPFSLLATFNLLIAVGLLTATFFIDSQIYRYFCLGAFASLLTATMLLLAITKVIIWPATISLRRDDCATR